MEMPRGWDDAEVDPVAMAFFDLPEVGMPPRPDTHGLDERSACIVAEVAPHAWRYAGDTLGTDFAFEAFAIAEDLGHCGLEMLRTRRTLTWARAIVWAVAERHDLIGVRGCGLRAGDLAAELGSRATKLRADAARLRIALGLAR